MSPLLPIGTGVMNLLSDVSLGDQLYKAAHNWKGVAGHKHVLMKEQERWDCTLVPQCLQLWIEVILCCRGCWQRWPKPAQQRSQGPVHQTHHGEVIRFECSVCTLKAEQFLH